MPTCNITTANITPMLIIRELITENLLLSGHQETLYFINYVISYQSLLKFYRTDKSFSTLVQVGDRETLFLSKAFETF